MLQNDSVATVQSLLQSTTIQWDFYDAEIQSIVLKILALRTQNRLHERLSILEAIYRCLPEASRCAYSPIQEEKMWEIPYAQQKVKSLNLKKNVEPNEVFFELLQYYRDCWKRFERWAKNTHRVSEKTRRRPLENASDETTLDSPCIGANGRAKTCDNCTCGSEPRQIPQVQSYSENKNESTLDRPSFRSYQTVSANTATTVQEVHQLQDITSRTGFAHSEQIDRGSGRQVSTCRTHSQASFEKSDSSLLTVVDLFAGAGGFRLGMEWAGFQTLAACDLMESNIETHRANFGESGQLKACDIRKIQAEDLTDQTPLIICAGPPCQGFSVIGKRSVDDERNQLIFEFARLVGELRPSYWVMENVPGLLLPEFAPLVRDLLAQFNRAGYETLDPVRLNCADYGVPQNRRRVFIFGWLRGMPPLKVPPPLKRRVSVGQALFDLPNASHYPELLEADELLLPEWPLMPKSDYSRLMRRPPVGREWNPLLVTNTRMVGHTKEAIAKFALVGPGGVDPYSRKTRLNPCKVSLTLRSGGGNYSAPWHLHPTENRSLTVREGARLSSFPDWFHFSPTRTGRLSACRQVGNALPPLMAYAIGAMIRESL